MNSVIVASKNPVKISCVKHAFSRVFPEINWVIKGIPAESKVSDQPLTEDETVRGAHNRARNVKKKQPHADYWVGIEGGVAPLDNTFEVFAWIVILGKNGVIGRGRTGSFLLPVRVSELLHEGYELGHADDKVFGSENSKQKNGSVGILTNDIITRTDLYEPAVIFALIPFINPSLY